MSERRRMQVGDWFNAAINIVIGLFLGVAADGLVQLATTDFWPMTVIILFLFAGVFLFERVVDKSIDTLFPSGIRPARKPQVKERTPLPRLLSLPAGVVLGIVLARTGLDTMILGVIA